MPYVDSRPWWTREALPQNHPHPQRQSFSAAFWAFHLRYVELMHKRGFDPAGGNPRNNQRGL